MKNGFVLILLLLGVIVTCVLVQFARTRRSMAEFAGMHGMSYTNSRWNLLSIGTIQSNTGHTGFFMGTMSTKLSFGPVSESSYPDEQSIVMCMPVKNMPRNMVIRRRAHGVQGVAAETVLARTGYPAVKTRDAEFDARFDVIGNPADILAWLTDPRREIVTTFLSRKNCAVASGNLKIEFTSSFIRGDDLKSAFLHISQTQLQLRDGAQVTSGSNFT